MKALDEPDAPDSTPLTPEDVEGLIPTWVATRAELNECEQENIESAIRWAFSRRGHRAVSEVGALLTSDFSDRLHQRMFGDVWRWAGVRRKRQTNIGVAPGDIAVQMKLAFDDVRYWHEQATFERLEIAVRLHHRLVTIHPYPNGNGRQTRLMADLYLHLSGGRPLSWGGGIHLGGTGPDRARYIDALRVADAGDLSALLAFATV